MLVPMYNNNILKIYRYGVYTIKGSCSQKIPMLCKNSLMFIRKFEKKLLLNNYTLYIRHVRRPKFKMVNIPIYI